MQPNQDKTLNHVLLQIVGPVLIMLMVSSLVFFLIEVVYRGPHTARLYWVMGLFTFASVLVARISIEEGKERAQLFGFALAIATLIASLQLVEFSALPILKPVILIGLIGVVMWTTNKLTWDCTVVDNSRDVSSSGSLERLKRTWLDAVSDEDTHPTMVSRMKHLLISGSRANSPGTWVIYFALVAFPLFGFGQWFVSPQSSVWVYLLFAVYFAAALGLLLTTSLLGLEKYLARRGVHVPAPIARNWMMIGGTFALAVMLIVALLPKPAGSSTLQSALSMLTSPLKQASDFAPGNDGQKDEPGADKKQRNDEGQQLDKNGEGGTEPGNKKGEGETGGGDADEEGDEQEDSQSDNNDEAPRNASEEQPNDRDSRQNQQQRDQDRREENRTNDESKSEPQRGDQNGNKPPPRKQQPPPPPQQDRSEQSNQTMKQILDAISKFANWVIYLVGFIAAAVLLFLFRRELIELFNLIFGTRRSKKVEDETDVAPESLRPATVPFSHFKNPFRSNSRQSLPQLVNYTMLALEAWGREFGIERSVDETPFEFARRLADADSNVARSAKWLADLYNQCAFSGKNQTQTDVAPLKQLWQQMESTVQKRRARSQVASSVG